MNPTATRSRTFGTKPIGTCAPDGTHRWASRHYEDGRYLFTTYNGWLIASETSTDDLDLAAMITNTMANRYDPEGK